MEFTFKVNGQDIVSEKEEVTAAELIEFAKEQDAINKEGNWQLRDHKGVIIDPGSLIHAGANAVLMATEVGGGQAAS